MSPHASWILENEIVPRLHGAVPRSVLCVGSEDPQELVQDGITMAARMLDRVEQQGKLGKVTPSNIAYYTIQHLKSGRRANGSRSVDAFGSSTQLNGASKLHSFSAAVCQGEAGDEIFELHDVISNDDEDPSVKAARKMDWDTFMADMSKVERLVIEYLVAGKTLREAGRSVGVGDSTMQTYRKRIAGKILAYMGDNILADSTREPKWRDNIHAGRERQALRLEVQWAMLNHE